MKTLVLAHRGSSAYAPENTLEAFRLAVEQGADGVELDVRLTKDGVVVVSHDNNLKRTCGMDVCVSDLTLEQLKKINCNLKFFEQGFHAIPTLAEVYELLAPTGLCVNVEIKPDALPRPGDMTLQLLALAKEYGMTERVIYSSFNHLSLDAVLKADPTAYVGLLYSYTALSHCWDYAKLVGAKALHPSCSYFFDEEGVVEACRNAGVDVNIWTVDDPDMIRKCMECQFHAVITNKPDVALAVRASL